MLLLPILFACRALEVAQDYERAACAGSRRTEINFPRRRELYGYMRKVGKGPRCVFAGLTCYMLGAAKSGEIEGKEKEYIKSRLRRGCCVWRAHHSREPCKQMKKPGKLSIYLWSKADIKKPKFIGFAGMPPLGGGGGEINGEKEVCIFHILRLAAAGNEIKSKR
jgi:hypothetical protein